MKEKSAPLLKIIKELDEILQLITTYPEALINQLDSFPIAICIFDLKGVFKVVNQAYCDQFGYTKDELLGDTFSKLLPEEIREKDTQKYVEGFKQDVDFESKVTQVRNKEGSVFPVVFSNVKLNTLRKEKLRISVLADISDLSQTEEQIDNTIHSLNSQIDNLKTQLNSQEVARNILLHDIKKPFHNIMGVIEILSSPEIRPEEREMWMQTIKELCQKGLQQAEAMQGITQMEMNQFKPNLSQFDLLEFLQEKTCAMQSLISSKDLDCQILYNGKKYSSEHHHCAIEGDQLFLELLFSNLMVNAIEASPEKQPVTCAVTESDRDVQVALRNMGTVPKEIRSDFFQKYVTLGKSKGTGMGTYIAKLITEAHHGHISMNTSEEKGTTIIVQLPKPQDAKMAA